MVRNSFFATAVTNVTATADKAARQARESRPSDSRASLIRYVRAPAGAMPAYTDKVITDQELTDIHAYLQTMAKAKPAKDIPLLNQFEKK